MKRKQGKAVYHRQLRNDNDNAETSGENGASRTDERTPLFIQMSFVGAKRQSSGKIKKARKKPEK